ncbi:hypothetical protein BV898_00781 [Hypsibius exemplaris]|uniref:Uncharacterized protein n=1 Tax=Hypsibius exemplaris TaxID=2072580 RepID=A0A1W0XCF2_HYPEX|nr:hypothetical protein BV898_00781 [Hypsibius exemplaris]
MSSVDSGAPLLLLLPLAGAGRDLVWRAGTARLLPNQTMTELLDGSLSDQTVARPRLTGHRWWEIIVFRIDYVQGDLLLLRPPPPPPPAWSASIS